MRELARGVRIGVSYAEPPTAYREEIRKAFPHIRMVDVFGSTENPIIAAQLAADTEGLCLYIHSFIAEIARPEDLHPSEGEEGRSVRGIPWWRWTKGMRGELLISRPGECLPLIRYATGDMIEVLDPTFEATFTADGALVSVGLPLIKVLGRSVDVLDYEVQDESGNLLGNKVYSRQINDALHGAQNVRWWEVFVVKGTPARMVFLVIPEKQPSDPDAFRKLLFDRLIEEVDKESPMHTMKVGEELGRFKLVIAPPEAYAVVQSEIDRRVSEGRPIGQLKPKRIHPVTEEELKEALLQRNISHELLEPRTAPYSSD